MWATTTTLPFLVRCRVPRGLEDVSKYPSLLAELLDSDRRWTEEDVKKLAGGNLLRVFREVERVGALLLLCFLLFFLLLGHSPTPHGQHQQQRHCLISPCC